ncbi:proteoglycan 4-like [Macrobrachium rosenbergii]|uniref:proteoglycan 4-like n=1 Tax=Macrobrachium rosenbergii TaxID=79674 RepID=UPI0034D75D6A
MKERTTPTWATWAVLLLVGLVGVAPGVSADLDLGVCQSTCSTVPQDLWPYCCETHHTCCEEFADSCIHDCLPRVNSGDVSAVEERPGLCCALYNLCCFRETPRISSIRSQGPQQPQSFPITHRFSTLPGGPGRNRQTSSGVPQASQAAATAQAPTTFSKPQPSNDNRRPTSPISRPKPPRKPSSSFRDTPRSENPEEEVLNSRDADGDNLGHRFDAQDTNSQKEEEESNAFNRPQTPNRPSKLLKFSRPVGLTPASEGQDNQAPDAQETVEARPNANTPKALERPRPGSSFRPTNPRPLSRPEPEIPEVTEQETEQEQAQPNRPSFLNRSLQQRKLTPSNPSGQSPTEEEPNQSQPKEEARTNKFIRSGPLIRSGVNRENSRPTPEITEEPEQATATEAENSRGPKLLRPKIKPFQAGKQEPEGSDALPPADEDLDQVVSDSVLSQQTVKEAPPSFLKPDGPPESLAKPAGPKFIGNGSPIRKIKLIRPRENNKTPQPKNQEQPVTVIEPEEPQQITADTTLAPPTTRSQATRGRTRNTSNAQRRTNTNTQESQGSTRGRTRFTQENSVDNTQSTQAASRERASSGRGRTRPQSRPVVNDPVEIAPSQDTQQPDVLVHEPSKLPSSTAVKNEEVFEEVAETSDAQFLNDEKIMEADKEMEKVMQEDVATLLENVRDTENIVPAGAPVLPEENFINEQENLPVPEETQAPTYLPTGDQNVVQPEVSKQVNDETDTEKMADQLSALGQSPKLVPSTRPGSQSSPAEALAVPELPRVTSQPQIREPVQSQEPQPFTRQPSEPQESTRPRTAAQAAARQRTSPASGQTATRSRGRLTARDRLALTGSDN